MTGPRPLDEGTLFAGRYRVERLIRAGGMGAVYEVVDDKTDRRRALKVMLPALVADSDMRERFRREATMNANVASEHLVETFDAGVDEATDTPFLVMELLRGKDLGALLRERERLPPREVIVLLSQTALALDRTHAENVVHRDLKPENLFLVETDKGAPLVKVLDFGVAKIVADSSIGATTRNVGTPLYMAPEQLKGEGVLDGRADLYSLAHIAYTLLVGAPYWQEEAQSARSVYPLLYKVAHGTPEPPSARALRHGVELPRAFDAWFVRATAADPTDRWDWASTMVAALAEALDVRDVTVAPSPPGPTRTRRGRSRRLALGAAVAACAVALAAATLGWRSGRSRGANLLPQGSADSPPAAAVSMVPRVASSAAIAPAFAAPPEIPPTSTMQRQAPPAPPPSMSSKPTRVPSPEPTARPGASGPARDPLDEL